MQSSFHPFSTFTSGISFIWPRTPKCNANSRCGLSSSLRIHSLLHIHLMIAMHRHCDHLPPFYSLRGNRFLSIHFVQIMSNPSIQKGWGGVIPTAMLASSLFIRPIPFSLFSFLHPTILSPIAEFHSCPMRHSLPRIVFHFITQLLPPPFFFSASLFLLFPFYSFFS